MARLPHSAYGLVLLAAALFGASIPLSKGLLDRAGPFGLAGLLYLGCGVGAFALHGARRRTSRAADPPLRRSDAPWVVGATLAGGVAAPVLLLFGLRQTPAHVAAFLANSETVFTILVAVLFFGDFPTRREIGGATLLLAGAALIAIVPAAGPAAGSGWLGPPFLLGAGLGWGLDNNFSQRISERAPLQISGIKGLAAGAANLALAWACGAPPRLGAREAAAALLIGFCCYGLSLAFFLGGLRHLGAARTSALFATDPAFSAALAWGILGEVPRLSTLGGGAVMIAGAWLLIRSEHSHRHAHEPLEHEHRHVHDEHHRHAHRGDEGPEPHTHLHRHERLEHEHPHVADSHHRHRHP